ncbi:PREDICTED: probable purine permease 11 isoform X1 [Nicotiana attenuata]|uniref:Probable purine permease n=1 Tax=Nicotiana attenuata TaxID=49451 RepID=A0A314LB72_NICAT|nr:PREDICTED: probable purine permease 11 isoform X1 [Nicotiana attenuata]OIT38838.1 putative purine permease 11 [Nicotiana attenuata]
MTADNQQPILGKDGASNGQHPLAKLNRLHFWLLLALNIIFLLAGQAAAVILGRFYYDKGGNSKWMATLVQTAAFPVLFIPYLFITSPQNDLEGSNRASFITVSVVYFVIGVMVAGDNMLYSIGLLYLSASTYSLICATQLIFSAVLSFFLNGQKFTALIMNSVVVLSLSTALLAVNDDTDMPSGVTKWKYVIGFLATLGASAMYALLLSLMQLSFQKVLKKETFSVVLEMQIYTALVATGVSIVGLFASGEWKTLQGEMGSFTAGKLSYVMTLVWTAIAWQICSVGVVGLVFVVSSLFSNVISTLSLAITPIAAVVILHDKMNGVKIIAMLMAIWGFGTYLYQNYVDDLKARKAPSAVDDAPTESRSC